MDLGWVVRLGVTKIKGANKIIHVFSLFEMLLILVFTVSTILLVN